MFIRPVPAGIPIMTLKTACATIKRFQDRSVARVIAEPLLNVLARHGAQLPHIKPRHFFELFRRAGPERDRCCGCDLPPGAFIKNERFFDAAGYAAGYGAGVLNKPCKNQRQNISSLSTS